MYFCVFTVLLFIFFSRYDEWVRPDRIVCVVDKPEMTRLKKKHLSPRSPKVSIKFDKYVYFYLMQIDN